ncbi:hypothetical protein ENBRE01_2611 [Enteropsectra breve]|nr:hypothetical protein ENBRE01_2611 [Enteropsectra breve]
MKRSLVRWSFEDCVFINESITILPFEMETKKEIPKSIIVHFVMPEHHESGIVVQKAFSRNDKNLKFWIRFTTQDGKYEIRQD